MANEFAQKGGSAAELSVQYVGVFDYYAIYYACINFLESRKFQVQHVLWKDKPDAPGTRERVIKLQGSTKADEYYKWVIDIELQLFNSNEVVVDMPQGKKTMVRGKIRAIIKGSVLIDYNDEYNTPFWKKMKVFLHNYIDKENFEARQWSVLYDLVGDMQTQIKTILHLDTQTGPYKGDY